MRSSTYSQAIAEAICTRIAEGESLRAICRDDGMPSYGTIFNWMHANEAFKSRYSLATQIRADLVFDEILDIADDASNDWMEKKNADGENIGWIENGENARRSALRIDARKWALARMSPKKYGDKLDLNHSGKISTAPEPDMTVFTLEELDTMVEFSKRMLPG